jgi:dihydroorotase
LDLTYLFILALTASVMIVSPLPAQERYDIVLRNGRVMDPETGLDAVRNVGIRGSVIAAISEEPLVGDTEIDASGQVIAPGFIDLHAHGQSNRGNEFQARDGVTTALELEDGVPDLAAFLATRGAGSVLNFGATISHMAARTWVMPQHADVVARAETLLARHDEDDLLALYNAAAAGAYDSLSPDQLGDLRDRLDVGLSQGALGIGMAHQYYPGASHEEIFRVFQMAADWEAPIFTHVREMGIAAMQEVVANAAATGAPLHIVHVNSSSLWNIGPVLDLIGGAQARGVDVTTEAYPYTAASTLLESAIFDEGWQDRLKISYGDLQWQDTGERLTAETFAKYREAGGVVIIHMMKPEWIEKAIQTDFVMVASDGMPYAPGAHPRSAGTFSRFLGRYVREQGLMPLMDALARITLMPAQRLENVSPQMRRKGRVQVGSDADITVFDPARIIDTATFEEDLSPSVGVTHVLVNGVFVVRDGDNVDGARPGRAVVGRNVVF